MADSFDFFESRIEHDFVNQDEVDISACNIQLKEVFENYYQTEVHETGDSFQLVEPFRKNYQIPMDEITAVYVVMHHLSELVRYDPESLEKMLSSDTEEGWLLKNFIETAPYTFLPRMFSWITGEQYYLVSR